MPLVALPITNTQSRAQIAWSVDIVFGLRTDMELARLRNGHTRTASLNAVITDTASARRSRELLPAEGSPNAQHFILYCSTALC